MAKVTDCVECGPEIAIWTDPKYLNSPYKGTRRAAKRQIKATKRNHGTVHYHLYTFDFNTSTINWVFGTNGRELIHNGRR